MSVKFQKIFAITKPVLGVIHVPALPGTPGYGGSIQAIYDRVMEEVDIYCRAGVDVIVIENMHDVPYLKRSVGPEITAAMGTIAKLVKEESQRPCGVQILAGANREALAVALAGGLDFIRAEGFVFGHLADEGWIDADAGPLLRYQKMIGAEHIAIFTDIKKKHSSHALTADVSLMETAKAAAFFRSDGLIITGKATGTEAAISDFQELRKADALPLMVGSGVTIENVEKYLSVCDGLIVGSWFKQEGYWANPLDYERIAAFMGKVGKWRTNWQP